MSAFCTAGCWLNDHCLPVGESETDQTACATYTCKETDSGPGYVKTELVTKYGK